MSTSYLFSVLRNFAFFLILTQESLDGNAFSNYNMKCCYGKYIRPWRSWISQQIPILKAGGSNPSGRTINAASVFTMLAAFYFFATYRRVYRQKKYTIIAPTGWTAL